GGDIFEPPAIKTPLPDLANRRILVVDDNISNQKVAIRMLRRLGCVPTVAANGEEAVDMHERFDFDLILMDCEMPIMDGFEATRKIRTLKKHGIRIPIVALTAHTSLATTQDCFSSGMDDYLSKPAELSFLAEKLDRWLKIAALQLS
ncbi:MAG: response regulator, partial [Chthoniobacterales bacterium]